MTPERAKNLLNRLGEHGAEVDQLLQKLNQVYELSIESTEERINPKLPEPVEVRVRNLAVARAVVMDMWQINKELQRLATPANETATGEIRYELIKTFVPDTEEWVP